MKHLNNLACVLAMLAAGSGFTACSSDDVPGGGNTDSGVAGKMVKTSFALNIPYGNKSGRMTAKETQANGDNFIGMEDMRLLAFDKDVATENKAIKKIVLGSSDQAFDSDNYRRVYRDVIIPVGTKNFLFYGKTYKAYTLAQGQTEMDKKFEVGSIKEKTTELSSTPSATNATEEIDLAKINFALDVIYGKKFQENSNVEATAKVVADALKSVYTVADENGKKWSDCNSASTDNVEKHAAVLFGQFKILKAGSAASAKATLESLKKGCGRNTSADATGEKNDILMAVAKACDAAITAIDNNAKKFPQNLGLPDGAASGEFGTDGVFTYADKGLSTADNTLDYTKVTYPAALNYYINTAVKANDAVIDNLNSSNGWPAYRTWTDASATWSNDWKDAVGNNTRTIALKNAIQYAVANLTTIVDIKDNAETLEDNAQTKGNLLHDQTISVKDNAFDLTGVLVGGQPSVVGWDYTPSTDTGTTYDYTIYDCNMNATTINSNTSATNYTLVFDNTNASDQDGAKNVYVTIELKNNTGTDFYGADGVVPAGGTFYLIGKLTPPTTGTLKNVFTKDYTTTAKLHISSLKAAYNTIPDLRSTQISLGLAVDLKWNPGLEFSVDL